MYMDAGEAARYLMISIREIRRLIREGTLDVTSGGIPADQVHSYWNIKGVTSSD